MLYNVEKIKEKNNGGDSMKVTFYSNFLTHHQVPFCLEMQKRLGDNFKFVWTMKWIKWKLDLWFEDIYDMYDFVV